MIEEPLVIGAGPAGLAVAATLGQHGRHAVVLERADSIGASWQGRYESLRLHTVRWLSGLPGAPIPRQYGPWVGRDDFVTYLREYAERFGVRPEFGVDVQRIERVDGTWRVETSRGDRSTSTVVVATGYSRVPHLPDWPGRDTFARPLVHSADYREPSAYRGRHVLVVGAGNSAAEIAVDLARVGARVHLSVRTPPNIVRRDTLGVVPSQLLGIALKHVPERVMNPLTTVLRKVTVPDLSPYGLPTPAGDGFTQFLHTQTVPILDHGFVDAVRAGRIRVVAEVESLDGDSVQLVDGSNLHLDAVLCATGYRTGLEPLVGHLGVLDERGLPLVHGPEALPELPGLYFVGISVELSGLLREIGREARAVGQAIAREPAGP